MDCRVVASSLLGAMTKRNGELELAKFVTKCIADGPMFACALSLLIPASLLLANLDNLLT